MVDAAGIIGGDVATNRYEKQRPDRLSQAELFVDTSVWY
jgi:hypothetical protein